MSTHEGIGEFDPRLLFESLDEPTEQELIINFLWRFNALAEETSNEKAVVRPQANSNAYAFYMSNHSTEVSAKAGPHDIPVGHYDPVSRQFIIYYQPEGLIMPGEADKISGLGEQRRSAAIESFHRHTNRGSTWIDKDHPDVVEFLRNQGDTLSDSGLARSLMEGQRMVARGSMGELRFDNNSRLEICADGPRLNSIYLRAIGGYRLLENDMKLRIGRIHVEVARRTNAATASHDLIYESVSGIASDDEVAMLVEFIREMQKVKRQHPTFDFMELGLRVPPSGEAHVTDLPLLS
jgi:hypothetical protein